MSNNPNQAFIKIPLKNLFRITRIVTIHCFDLAPKYLYKGESHDFWEIVYVDRGEIGLHAGEEYHRLKQGEMVFHQPNEFHNIECDGVHGASVFIITFDCHSPAMQFFCGRIVKVPKTLLTLVKLLIEECANTFHVSEYPLTLRKDAPVGGQQLIRLYLEELLIRLMRSYENRSDFSAVFTSREGLENTLVQQICAYLSQHVYDSVTLEILSEVFHFGKSHLCDVFKKNTGDTIIHYFLRLKIAEAKRLLREEKLTVSEVSTKLSFDSPAYFSRCFHKYTGMSPVAFRGKLINSSAKYKDS